jgi:hypothetical protein
VWWNETALLYNTTVDTSELGTFFVYIHGRTEPGIFAYSKVINITIDFPCELDDYYLNPVVGEFENEELFVKHNSNFRLVFRAEPEQMDTYTINLSERFTKLSPEGKCAITHYEIKRVQSETNYLPKDVFDKYFAIDEGGNFTILSFSHIMKSYKVYIAPCNNQTCGTNLVKSYNFAAVISIISNFRFIPPVAPRFLITPEFPKIDIKMAKSEIEYKLPPLFGNHKN